MSKKTKIIGSIVIVLIMIASAPSKEEKDAEQKVSMEKLKVEVLKINALNVDDNLYAYKNLVSYYPENKTYKSKYAKYKHMSDIETMCRTKSREQDKQSLKNPNTYNGETDRFNKWLSSKEFITSSSFMGKNSFNVEFKFNSQYKCSITKEGVQIEKMYMKQL
ncbi:MAG: hypothetical protein COB61_005840 [Thiotrichales bacterium]|nr:hypothetical protein [Thiotrichales bacterium]